ncbi:MAG: asparaginase [Sulfurovum sp.]|nr:asparaginase [Sulfurovum sp.]
MNGLLIINTGGTFNKQYNPVNGKLYINKMATFLETIAKKWMIHFKIINIIGKDSLEITSHDRLELLTTIHQAKEQKIIVVHGTDTMHTTATYLDDAKLQKCIVLTGAMVPYSIDPVEATANFSSAYGFLYTLERDGIYIAMNGIISPFNKITKDRNEGKFVQQ